MARRVDGDVRSIGQTSRYEIESWISDIGMDTIDGQTSNIGAIAVGGQTYCPGPHVARRGCRRWSNENRNDGTVNSNDSILFT